MRLNKTLGSGGKHRDERGKGRREKKEAKKEKIYLGDSHTLLSPVEVLPSACSWRSKVMLWTNHFSSEPQSPQFPNKNTYIFPAYLTGGSVVDGVLPKLMFLWNY